MSDQLPRQFGPYSLLKLLAKGGMGEIYLARTAGIAAFEKYYAVKRLLKKFAHDSDVSARFIDEAKLGARLQHPNIVQVYDLGKVTDELYMATEFVDGFDLRRVLRFCHEKKKRIPLDIALFIVREILSGLAYAHRQVDAEGQSINLIHRDISPQNVLVSFEGEVKIIDFGLAKSTQRSQETQANVLLGNFGYMSPEQARGQRLDVRTDVYSCGIVLFELVTGTKRFVDENPLRLLEMVARPTPIMPSDRAPDIPKAIDRIYSGATSAPREDRYKDAEGFRDEVTQALHKLNPRATREHLAQFLNHLFLGGAAPPEVDNDALNKSVAMQVKDIYEQSNAFTTTKEDDVQDRDLSDFNDEEAQTGSHALMRAARVGDTLSHQELTGEDKAPAEAAAHAPPRPPSPAPLGGGESSGSVPSAVAPMPPPAAAPSANDSNVGAVSLGDQLPPPPQTLSAAPTSTYEAPSFPSAAPAPEKASDPRSKPPIDPKSQPPRVHPEPDEIEIDELDLEPLELEPVDTAPEPAAPTPAAPTPVAPTPQAIVSELRGSKPELTDPERDEPTMVVDFDSLPGASIEEGATERHLTFGEGSGESLIIDFDMESLDDDGEETERAVAAPAPTEPAQPLPGTPAPAPAPAPPQVAGGTPPSRPRAPGSGPSAPSPQQGQPPQPPQPPQAPPQPQPQPQQKQRPKSRDGAPPGGSEPVIRPAAQPRGRVATGGVARQRRGSEQPPSQDDTPPKRR